MNTTTELIPDSLSLYETVKFGGILNRANSYQPSQGQSGYQPGQLLQFTMPSEFLDLQNHSWQFTIQGSSVGGTYARFNNDIRSIVKRLTIAFGPKVVYDCNNQGLLYNIMNQLKDVNWNSGAGKILNGTGSQAERNGYFTNPNKVYAVQLYNMHTELLAKVLPFQKLNVQMYINIYLAPAAECIETDGTSASYVVNNNQFHIASLIPSAGWDSEFNSKIPRGISYNYVLYENTFMTNLLNAGITRASATLNFRYSSLLGIFGVMRPSAGLTSFATNNKLSEFDFNNLNQVQLRMGSYVNPVDPTTSNADCYTMVCENFNKSTQDSLALPINYDSNNFIFAINLSKHPWVNPTQNLSVNGYNSSVSTAIILDLGFSSALSQNYSLDIYAQAESSVIWQVNGAIQWQN